MLARLRNFRSTLSPLMTGLFALGLLAGTGGGAEAHEGGEVDHPAATAPAHHDTAGDAHGHQHSHEHEHPPDEEDVQPNGHDDSDHHADHGCSGCACVAAPGCAAPAVVASPSTSAVGAMRAGSGLREATAVAGTPPPHDIYRPPRSLT
jgi:hypothetical protein